MAQTWGFLKCTQTYASSCGWKTTKIWIRPTMRPVMTEKSLRQQTLLSYAANLFTIELFEEMKVQESNSRFFFFDWKLSTHWLYCPTSFRLEKMSRHLFGSICVFLPLSCVFVVAARSMHIVGGLLPSQKLAWWLAWWLVSKNPEVIVGIEHD